MEPSYTGVVKGISLAYTRILTDSSALLKVPNSIVTQSLMMNLSPGRQGMIAVQFEALIQIGPRDLRKKLNSNLSKIDDFRGEEDSFEILEVSSASYLVSLSYKVEKQTERQMKSLLLNGVRDVLNDAREQKAK